MYNLGALFRSNSYIQLDVNNGPVFQHLCASLYFLVSLNHGCRRAILGPLFTSYLYIQFDENNGPNMFF